MSLRNLLLPLLAAFALQQVASAHDDVVPYGFGGKIVTGGHDDSLGTDTIVERVFGYDFGEDPFDPYVIGDPGFNNGSFAVGIYPNDGLLPTNQTLGFAVLTNLLYWDGVGAVSFDPAEAGVDLGITRGSNTVHISGTGLSGTTPTIKNTGASGRLHEHTTSTLNFTDGADPTSPNAPDGIYMFGMTLTLTGGALTNSDPIYFVYNNNLDEEIHDLAINWVNTNMVPEPSSWILLGMGAASIAAAKRRSRERRKSASPVQIQGGER